MLSWKTKLPVLIVIVAIFYARSGKAPLKTHPRGIREQNTIRNAIVVGASGATGRKLVDQLMASPFWTVTAIVRRKTTVLRRGMGFPSYREIILSDLFQATREMFQEHDVLFNCLGTTRAGGHSPSGNQINDTSGADNFVNVEVNMSKVISELAVQGGIQTVSVISAEGANPNFLSGHNWIKWIHPLLYMRTLGEKEQVTINAGFKKVSIFRPGLLNRETKGIFQQIQDLFGLGLKVSTLAKSMVRDVETMDVLQKEQSVMYYETNEYIMQASKL